MKDEQWGNDLVRRTIAYNSMNEELRQESDNLLRATAQARQDELRHWHQLGMQATELWLAMAEETSRVDFWSFSRTLGHKPQELQWAMDFSQWLDEKRLKALLSRYGQGGITLTWGHVTSLVKVHDVKQREALLELVFERGLTARDLAQEIAKRNRKAKAEATPGHLLPRGTKNSLDFLGSMAQKVREFCEKRFASAIYDPLMNTEGEGLDQRTITKVTDVRQRVEELVNNLLESVCPGLSDIEGHLNSLGLPPGPKQPRGLSDRDKSSPFGRWRELP